MATPAQCLTTPAIAKHSLGSSMSAAPENNQGELRHGLFTTYEHLAPADSSRVKEFIAEMQAGIPKQHPIDEDVIRDYAIAKWRCELFYRMEASCLTSAIADERANPENAILIEKHGEGILLGHALRHDAEGANIFSKLMRYEARVKKELILARAAYLRLLDRLEIENANANPIPRPTAASPQPAPPKKPTETPRNATCPCGSGQKFKRCCGDGAPAVLGSAQAAVN